MIQLIKGIAGAYGKAYASGDTCSFEPDFEAELITKGFAVKVPEKTIESKSGGLQSDDSALIESKAIPVSDKRGNRSGRRNH